MATLKKWLNNRYVIGWSLVFWLIADLVIVGWKCDLSKSDWGTWVGSIGTVGTLIGTIWLATDAERKRERKELDLALICAAGLVVRFSTVHSALTSAQAALPADLSAPDDPRLAYRMCLQFIDDAGLWNEQDLVPLVHLPNKAAADLAWILTNIRFTRNYLQRLCEREQVTWDTVEYINSILFEQLRANLDPLDHARRECVAFLVHHRFRDA